MANALKSSLSSVRIDQHSPGGKRLQTAVQEKLKEYMGPEYSDEVTIGIGLRGVRCKTIYCRRALIPLHCCSLRHDPQPLHAWRAKGLC